MKNTLNPYKIKWTVIVSLSPTFNSHYRSALRKAGFSQMGNADIFADHFNPDNIVSADRMAKQVKNFKMKTSNYKHQKGFLMVTITDKQFGMIGRNINWKHYNIPTSLGNIPVTSKQMIA